MGTPLCTFALALFAAAAGCDRAPPVDAGAPQDARPVDADAADAADVAPADAARPRDDLAAMLEPIRAAQGVPALAAGVFDSEGTIALGAVGVRAQGEPEAVTVDDRFHLGSCTKAMTATLVARLAARSGLGWDTTLAAALPDLAARMDPAYRAVSIATVLQHRGGVAGDIPRSAWDPLWRPGEVTAQRATFAGQILALAPAGTPGATFVYSNAGYMVVGAALERATGRAWEASLRDEVFAPLEMRSCGFGAPATPGQIDQPWGHREGAGGLVPVAPGPGGDNPPALGPAGTVHCSLEDWGRFARAHLRGARGEASYLPAEAFARMHAPPAGGDYALGWGVATRPWTGGPALTHDGSNTMFYASVWIAPARDRVLLVATNVANAGATRAVSQVITALSARYAAR